jgi:hypothetical protein
MIEQRGKVKTKFNPLPLEDDSSKNGVENICNIHLQPTQHPIKMDI